jgi:hypothetical protein
MISRSEGCEIGDNRQSALEPQVRWVKESQAD